MLNEKETTISYRVPPSGFGWRRRSVHWHSRRGEFEFYSTEEEDLTKRLIAGGDNIQYFVSVGRSRGKIVTEKDGIPLSLCSHWRLI